MLESLSQLFSAVCGQNPQHTWAPGGLLLPCCQRCTGVYAGAVVALLLHRWLKPRMSGRFLEVHGLFLLQMVPFGFQWLPQGAVLRTLTGGLFGFSVATFLTLVPATRWKAAEASRPGAALGYVTGLVATVALLPALAAWGGRAVGVVLSGLAGTGALLLAVLALLNAAFAVVAFLKWLRRPERSLPA